MVTLILIFMSPGEWKIVIIVYSFSRCYRLFYVAIKQKLHVYGTNQMVLYCLVYLQINILLQNKSFSQDCVYYSRTQMIINLNNIHLFVVNI